MPIRVLMHESHARKLARVLGRLNATLPAQIIALGRPHTMLDVRDALARGEIVAFLADRSMHGDRQVWCDFLGGRAGFPRGPFELAALLGAPVMLFSATYEGRMRYDVRFAPNVAACVCGYDGRVPTLQAVVDVLTGARKPVGSLPVAVSDRFPIGAGMRDFA